MDIWQRLDISPDSDLATIKRAYAKQLKKCRPDEDPEGFQALRSAFEAAKQFATDEGSINIPTASLKDIASRPFDPNRDLANPDWQPTFTSQPEQEPEPETKLETHEQDLPGFNKHLYCAGLISRIDNIEPLLPDSLLHHHWEKILQEEGLWHLETKQLFSDYLFQYLIDHKKQAPVIWQIINQHVHWQTQEFRLADRFDEEDVHFILNKLEGRVEEPEQPILPTPKYKKVEEKRSYRFWHIVILFIIISAAIRAINTPSTTVEVEPYYPEKVERYLTPSLFDYDKANDQFIPMPPNVILNDKSTECSQGTNTQTHSACINLEQTQ